PPDLDDDAVHARRPDPARAWSRCGRGNASPTRGRGARRAHALDDRNALHRACRIRDAAEARASLESSRLLDRAQIGPPRIERFDLFLQRFERGDLLLHLRSEALLRFRVAQLPFELGELLLGGEDFRLHALELALLVV